MTGGLLCRSNPIDSFGKNQRLEFFSAFLFPVLDRNLRSSLLWNFSVTSTPHCSCNDSCLDCYNVPYHPTRCQPEASLVVKSSHGEESVVSERLLTRGAHLARPTVTNHLAVCVVFPLHLLVNLGLILTI